MRGGIIEQKTCLLLWDSNEYTDNNIDIYKIMKLLDLILISLEEW